MLFVDFVIRSGRALLYPIYSGTYERHVDVSGPNTDRDITGVKQTPMGPLPRSSCPPPAPANCIRGYTD
jgi:hypothetical protein